MRKKFTERYGAAEYKKFDGKIFKLLASDFKTKSHAKVFVKAGDIIWKINYYRIVKQSDGWYAVYIKRK